MSIAAAASRARAEPATAWRRHLTALAIAAGAVLMLLAGDAAHMATIWWTSSTFNHCLLIVPIIAWLVWQRAPALAGLTPSVWPVGLAVVGAGSLAWMLGDAAGVSLFRHAGLVIMLQGAVVTLLGRDVARALAFPLFYALFLIPAGEELVPLLQVVTAQLSMALLGLAGIPAHMEGVFITTPGGYFEVAEACSGVKFLVAMLALGVLIAHVGFRSWPRRLAFVATALIVPVLANGVRAFATILVAAETSNAAASGFDHVVYGWFFFGFVIAIVMGLAWRFFDRSADEAVEVRAPVAAVPAGTSLPLMLGLALTLVAAPIAWSASAAAGARDIRLPALAAPVVPGWTPVARAGGVPWTPRFAGADRLLVQRYRDAQGREVDLVVAAYAWQGEGRELVGYGQGVVAPDGGWSWSQGGSPPAGGRADRIVADGAMREVLSFYRVGGVTTGSDAAVKLETLKARLLGRSQAAVAVLVSSQAVRGEMPPRVAIDAFLRSLGPVPRLADRVVGA
ncbi:MAG TPA: exosortase A [Sphingomonadaceae bacterium]|nr:exosortase A [Sphingomonadaceae bacterium]